MYICTIAAYPNIHAGPRRQAVPCYPLHSICSEKCPNKNKKIFWQKNKYCKLFTGLQNVLIQKAFVDEQ